MQVPAPFEYARAATVDEAIGLLERLGPEARLVAGGHSLLPMMKLRLATPEHLIDINPLESELGYIRDEGGEIHIGALTRHREVLDSELLAERFPIIRDAELLIADPPVRNRGTVGGALCQADPSEDLSAVFAALGARAVIRGRDGERDIDMVEFHQGPYETAVGDAEMLVEVRVPVREHHGSAYEKVKRRTGDWATAAAGAALWLDGPNIAAAGIALSAVNPHGVRSTRAEEAVIGGPPSEEAFAEAARLAAEDCDPIGDQRGPADYKRHLARELTQRALRGATERALAT
ncbi:MAG: xanthine dehydrogenase family protein subunit M [Thermoleophilaceae bacterium]|jgi:carbon-monoxide dehydrogenase medium subunit|nr:xanthine dehydrogenase family protein subunit M [Thermoleophilaceae bacterium]